MARVPTIYRLNKAVLWGPKGKEELVTAVKRVAVAGYVSPSYYGFRIYWNIEIKMGKNEYAEQSYKDSFTQDAFSVGTEGPIGKDYPSLRYLLKHPVWLHWVKPGSDDGWAYMHLVNESEIAKFMRLSWKIDKRNELHIQAQTDSANFPYTAAISSTRWSLELLWRASDDGTGNAVLETFGPYGDLGSAELQELGRKKLFNKIALTRWKPVEFFKA